MLRHKDSENSRLMEAMKKCPLFSELSGGELKDVLKISHIRDYSADEKIFEEGTLGLCFYLIVKGSVAVTTGTESKTVILKEMGQDAYFSEVHMFSETYHTVSCSAKEVTRVLVLAKPDLEELVSIKPKLGIKLLLKFLDFFGEKLEKLYKENRELKQNYPG
jgi:CRP-like cAMP-binding protein